MASKRRRVSCMLAVVLVGGFLAVLLLGAVGLWVGLAARSAAEVWPQGIAALEIPEPALPVDPVARERLDELLELIPDGISSSDLQDALAQEGPPPADLALLEELDPALPVMDALVECSGLGLEPLRLDQEGPHLIDVMHLSRHRLARAWRYAEQERSDEALAEMMRTARLGLMLEQAGGHLLAAMVGLAISDMALSEMVELVAWEHPPSPAILAALASELDAARRLPTAMDRAILSECIGGEALLDEMRWWSRDQIWATSSFGDPGEPPELVEPGGPECCFLIYDADRTIQLARQRCQRVAAAVAMPGSLRVLPDHEPLRDSSRLDVGSLVDNPVGRILLDISMPSYGGFMEKDDALRSRRALVAAWLGVKRWQLEHPGEEPPPSLDELVPRYLIEVPLDPWDGEPVAYDPGEGKLSVALCEEGTLVALEL
jgi:hypothetical protein